MTPPSLRLPHSTLYQKIDSPRNPHPKQIPPLWAFSAHCLDKEILKVSLTGGGSEREESESASLRSSGVEGEVCSIPEIPL